MNLLYWRF